MRAAGVADVLVRIVEQRRERLAAEGFGDGLAEALARGQAAAEPVVPGPGSARSPGAATLAAESTGPADSPLTATTNRFLAALSATPAPAVIAEIKMGSPRLGLVPLIETHDPADLDLLAGAGTGDAWELVGINHRDLRTFEVDLGRSAALLPRLPAGALKVAESGIASAADVARLAAGGFDAFLIGESLLLAPDPAAKLRELRG